MPQQVIDLGESFRPWQKTIWVLWIAENKVMAVAVAWKQMDWISCSHESTNTRAVCHVPAVIWPLVIDSWLQCLFGAALLWWTSSCDYWLTLKKRVAVNWNCLLGHGGSDKKNLVKLVCNYLQNRQTYWPTTTKPPPKKQTETSQHVEKAETERVTRGCHQALESE